jgi:hypothetical protein
MEGLRTETKDVLWLTVEDLIRLRQMLNEDFINWADVDGHFRCTDTPSSTCSTLVIFQGHASLSVDGSKKYRMLKLMRSCNIDPNSRSLCKGVNRVDKERLEKGKSCDANPSSWAMDVTTRPNPPRR